MSERGALLPATVALLLAGLAGAGQAEDSPPAVTAAGAPCSGLTAERIARKIEQQGGTATAAQSAAIMAMAGYKGEATLDCAAVNDLFD